MQCCSDVRLPASSAECACKPAARYYQQYSFGGCLPPSPVNEPSPRCTPSPFPLPPLSLQLSPRHKQLSPRHNSIGSVTPHPTPWLSLVGALQFHKCIRRSSTPPWLPPAAHKPGVESLRTRQGVCWVCPSPAPIPTPGMIQRLLWARQAGRAQAHDAAWLSQAVHLGCRAGRAGQAMRTERPRVGTGGGWLELLALG